MFLTSNKKLVFLNEYFANHCTINDNGSLLPGFSPQSDVSLSHIYATHENIVNSKKAHGCDGNAVSMLQLCATEVAHPLRIIFNKCITTGMFPDSWKYANVQPIHKNDNRQTVNNYRPISLLPICGKSLEKIVFDKV